MSITIIIHSVLKTKMVNANIAFANRMALLEKRNKLGKNKVAQHVHKCWTTLTQKWQTVNYGYHGDLPNWRCVLSWHLTDFHVFRLYLILFEIYFGFPKIKFSLQWSFSELTIRTRPDNMSYAFLLLCQTKPIY